MSLVSEEVHEADAGVAAALVWLVAAGRDTRVRRLIVETLLREVSSFGSARFGPSSVSPDRIFDSSRLFPSCLPYLSGTLSQEVRDLLPNAERPFDSAQSAPRVPLAVLIAGSPYQCKLMQQALINLVISFQYDSLFRAAFTQLLTLLYPSLTLLAALFVGSAEDSVLVTSVQVLSARSMADLMSSEGLPRRPFPEQSPVCLLPLLLRCMRGVLAFCGSQNADAFLEHSALSRLRLSHPCRDANYLLRNPSTLDMLLGQRDSETLPEWLSLCCRLQGLFPMKRQIRQHVQQEEKTWHTAANLALEVDGVGATMLSNGILCSSNEVSSLISAVLRIFSLAMHAIDEHFNSTESIQPGAKTMLCLDHEVSLPCVVFFRPVSSSGVSILISLHRFICRLIDLAARSGLDVSPFSRELEAEPSRAIALLHAPLRALVWASQVNIGMWRRNGDAASNLCYNYCRSPLCRDLRDLDIIAVQLAVTGLGPNTILAILIEVYELSPVLENFNCSDSNASFTNEYTGPLIAELLRLLIHVIVNVPSDLNTKAVAEDSIRRELVQRVFAEQSFKKILETRIYFSEFIDADILSPGDIRRVLSEITVKRESSGTSMLLLRQQYHSYLDIDHIHMSRADLERNAEGARLHRRQALDSGSDVAVPIIGKEAIPTIGCNLELVRIRSLLYTPLFLEFLRRTMILCFKSGNHLRSSNDTVVGRVVYLLTLQVHCIGDSSLQDFQSIWQSTVGVKLLAVLLSARNADDFPKDELCRQGLDWFLRELYGLAPDLSPQMDAAGMKPSTAETKSEGARKLRDRAQRRVMQRISANVASFAEEMDIVAEEEVSHDDTKLLDSGTSECVVCRSLVNKPLGYIAHCQPSTVLKTAVTRECGKVKLYRIVALSASSYSSPSLDAPVIHNFVQGDLIHVESRRGTWMKLQGPSSEWMQIFRPKRSGDGLRAEPVLFPVVELQFAQWGGARVYGEFEGEIANEYLNCMQFRVAVTPFTHTAWMKF